MPNTINIVQPKAEDGVTEVSFVTRTNSIYKSDGTPLGDSLDAYMDEVDELSQNLTECMCVITASETQTCAGNSYKEQAISFANDLPSGFKAVGIVGYNVGSSFINIFSATLPSATTARISWKNTTSSSITAVVTAYVLCVKTSMYKAS